MKPSDWSMICSKYKSFVHAIDNLFSRLAFVSSQSASLTSLNMVFMFFFVGYGQLTVTQAFSQWNPCIKIQISPENTRQ